MAGGIDEVLVSYSPGETRLALIEGGYAAEFIIDRGEGQPGDIVLGRVLSSGQKGGFAFIDIGEGVPAVLKGGGAAEGGAVLVQITASARGEKGAELTRAVTLEGRLLIFSPMRPGLAVSRRLEPAQRERLKTLLQDRIAPGEGVVARSAAAAAEGAALDAELAALRARWADIQARAERMRAPSWLVRPHPLEKLLQTRTVGRVRVDDAAALALIRVFYPDAEHYRDGALFDLYDASEVLEAALQPVVTLPGGASLLFGTAAGLSVIDIDSGPLPPEDVNRAAMPEIARQLRLRALSGHILVDVIPMRRAGAHAGAVAALKAAIAGDPTPTHVVGTTPLGMIEMTRDRLGPSLGERMLEMTIPGPNAPTLALEGVRALLRESAANPGRHHVLAASPAVAAVLNRRPDILAEAARRLGEPLRLTEMRDVTGYEIREG